MMNEREILVDLLSTILKRLKEIRVMPDNIIAKNVIKTFFEIYSKYDENGNTVKYKGHEYWSKEALKLYDKNEGIIRVKGKLKFRIDHIIPFNIVIRDKMEVVKHACEIYDVTDFLDKNIVACVITVEEWNNLRIDNGANMPLVGGYIEDEWGRYRKSKIDVAKIRWDKNLTSYTVIEYLNFS